MEKRWAQIQYYRIKRSKGGGILIWYYIPRILGLDITILLVDTVQISVEFNHIYTTFDSNW